MAYAIENDLLGQTKIGNVDTAQNFQLGTMAYAIDPTYGGGEFIYLAGATGITVGSVVQYDQYTATTALWAGTANSARPLAIAMAATVAGTFGWFQISGAAVVNISGTVAAGANAYWQANGVVSSTAVAGKQIQSMFAVSANGVPAAGQAVYQISRISGQDQIT